MIVLNGGQKRVKQLAAIKLVGIALACAALLSGCISMLSPTTQNVVTVDKTFGNYDDDLEPDLVLITMTPEEHDKLTNTTVNLPAGALPPQYYAFVNRLSEDYGLTRVADWPLATIDIYCIIFENDGPLTREALLDVLVQEPNVESAQLVNSFEVQAKPYNDPYFSLQHGFHSIQAIVSHAWSRGAGVRVAVVDTGLDTKHPDLTSSTELTRNFVDQNEAVFHEDIHGTAIGGVIAATANNATGMAGIAPDAQLLSLKACWYDRFDKGGAQCNSLTLAKALNFSIQQDVDIINLSLTGPPDPLLERLIQAALSNNIIVIGAKPPHNNAAFPTSVEGTIAVALPSEHNNSLSAPGRRVLSTMPNEKYDFFDGSSFSTAHISGLAAVIRSVSPALSPEALLALLENTADPASGAVNACRAMHAVLTKQANPVALEPCK